MTEPRDMPPDGRELEEFLARRSGLSRRYREALPPEPAPPRLDAPVLAQARRELRRAGRPPRRWWPRHFATAAAVLLVAGLAWMVRQQPLTRPVEAVAPQGTPLNSPVPPPVAAPAPAMLVPPLQAGPRDRVPQQQERKAQAATPAIPTIPPPPAATANAAQSMKEAPSTQAQVAGAVEQPLAAAAPAPDGAPPAQSLGRSSKSEDSAAPAPAPRSTYTAPPAPASPPPAVAPTVAPLPAPPASEAAEAKKMQTLAAACSASQRAAAQLQARPEFSLDSPVWLEQIRRLQATDAGAARAELACFVAARPREAVPDDLRALLPVP